ncbi:MAG: adenosylcobinamide-GDP ribazoletransferase [Fibrobacterales bacterium]
MLSEIKTLLHCIRFFTRIPVPQWVGYSDDYQYRSTKYLPLIGYIVGGASALTFYLCSTSLSIILSLIISTIVSIILTGAFHEDGLADFCDGFGGGYGKEKILAIMKDSRIGTYGSVALISILSLKIGSLVEIPIAQLPIIILAGHCFSRFIPLLLMRTTSYVSIQGKSHHLQKSIPSLYLFFGLLTLAPLSIWIPWQILLINFVICVIILTIFRYYIMKHIDGYTGDILGTVQQVSEIIFYIGTITIGAQFS